MIQIDPPTPTFMTRHRRPGGRPGPTGRTPTTTTRSSRSCAARTSARRSVKALKLDDQPPYKGNPDAGALFMSHVGVEPIPESRLVIVTVTHTSPKEAALWANALADVYIESSIEGRVETAKKAYDWLQERLTATQKQHARGPGQALPELPDPGPLRARGIGVCRHHLHHQAQRRLHRGAHPPHHHRGRGAAAARHARAGREPGRGAPGGGRRGGGGPQHPDRGPQGRPVAPAGEVQARPSRGAEDRGPDRRAQEGPGGPGRADHGRPPGRVHPAPEARERAQGRDRRAESRWPRPRAARPASSRP